MRVTNKIDGAPLEVRAPLHVPYFCKLQGGQTGLAPVISDRLCPPCSLRNGSSGILLLPWPSRLSLSPCARLMIKSILLMVFVQHVCVGSSQGQHVVGHSNRPESSSFQLVQPSDLKHYATLAVWYGPFPRYGNLFSMNNNYQWCHDPVLHSRLSRFHSDLAAQHVHPFDLVLPL